MRWLRSTSSPRCRNTPPPRSSTSTPTRSSFFNSSKLLGVDAPVDSSLIDSQVEILKSENVAQAVIKDLHLLDDPEFTGPPGGLLGAIVGFIGRLTPGADAPRSQYALTRQAVARFAKALTIKRLGLSYVMEIDFQSVDPQRAAKIANAIADAYVVDSLESKYQSSRRAATWLQDRLKELRAQASDAERAVVEYKANNNIVDTGGRLLNEQQLAELNSALTSAQAVRAEAEARAQRVEAILQAVDDKGISAETATVTDTLHNDVITRLRQQYLDLAERESDWEARYGPTHLAVVNLRNQMLEIRRSIADELKRIAETYRSDLDIARSHEESIKQDLASLVTQSNQTSQAQVTLHELDANSQSYRALTDNFLQLYMVSVQQQSFPVTKSRLITEASPPLNPSSPKLLMVMAIAVSAAARSLSRWRPSASWRIASSGQGRRSRTRSASNAWRRRPSSHLRGSAARAEQPAIRRRGQLRPTTGCSHTHSTRRSRILLSRCAPSKWRSTFAVSISRTG